MRPATLHGPSCSPSSHLAEQQHGIQLGVQEGGGLVDLQGRGRQGRSAGLGTSVYWKRHLRVRICCWVADLARQLVRADRSAARAQRAGQGGLAP